MNVSRDKNVQSQIRGRVDVATGTLRVMAAAHPDEQARKLARDLVAATGHAFTSADWLVHGLGTSHYASYRDTALADPGKAEEVLNRLLEAIARAK